MAEIIVNIIGTFTSFVYYLILAFMFAYAYSPKVRAKVQAWRRRHAYKFLPILQKIDLFITEITIILHDSLVSTILLVLAITSLYDEVKPMLDNFTSVNALIVSLNASLIKSPIPHLFFAVIFLIWIWGFLVKRLKEDNDIKEEKLWKKEVSETLSNIEKLLRGGKQYDN